MNGKRYVYTGDYKIADKNLGNGTAVTINAYEPLNDLEGYLILSETASANDCNYYSFTINGKEKYFMVTSKEAMTGGRCRVNLYQDVLKTWWDEIKEFDCIILNTTDANDNNYTKDAPGNFPCYQFNKIAQVAKKNLRYKDTRAGATQHYILVTVGSASGISAEEAQDEIDKRMEDYYKTMGITDPGAPAN